MDTYRESARCVCCGKTFMRSMRGRPASMCESCRAMKPSDRPKANWITVSCQECGKPMLVPPKSRPRRCTACSRRAQKKSRELGVTTSINEGAKLCDNSMARQERMAKQQEKGGGKGDKRERDFSYMREYALMKKDGILHHAETYDMGSCERCAYSPKLNAGRCAMLKPPSKTTCEWFSETAVHAPRAVMAHAGR